MDIRPIRTDEDHNAEARDIRHDRLIDGLSAFERRYGHEAARSRLCAFMVEYLAPLKRVLPQDISAAFETAEKFKDEFLANEDMERARDACWKYLSAAGAKVELDFANKANCAVRAVLSALHREPPRLDLREACYWFLLFADVVEDQSAMLDDLVTKHFDGGIWLSSARRREP